MARNAVPPDVVSLDDYERHARRVLADDIWAYVAGAASGGLTARWNREALDRISLAGRVLCDMRGASTASTLFARELGFPVILAPVAYQKLAHPDGEIATVLGAGAARAWMCVSTQASVSLEQVAASAHGPLWFQLYMQVDREASLDLVRRAEAAGYSALVVTVDAPVTATRHEERRAGFGLPPDVAAVNVASYRSAAVHAAPGESPVFRGMLDTQPRWDDLEWLRSATRLPLLVKGVCHPDDAMRAIGAGADGIVVSNHGGRVLDTLPATARILPRVAAAVAGRVPVLVDGGVRRGTDILKLVALGASAVLVGQPIMHALAVAGAAGVAHMLTLLRVELEAAMALTGCPTVADIGPHVLWDSAVEGKA